MVYAFLSQRLVRSRPLPWETRLKISTAAAHCLAFLHSRKKAGLYRRYLTASKIMLVSEFNARISYFGLKTLPSQNEGPHVSSGPYEPARFRYASSRPYEPARFHYAPPEYIFTGKSHMPGDVYIFGIILLEILTGYGKQRIIVAKRAISNDKENIAEMIDPDLENSYPLEQGMRMCEVIKQCLDKHPMKRPSMQQVVDDLNAVAQI